MTYFAFLSSFGSVMKGTYWAETNLVSFLFRAVLAFVVTYIGASILHIVRKRWPAQFNHKDVFDEYVNKKTRHWTRIAWVLGYFLIPGMPIDESQAFTLPMALLSIGIDSDRIGLESWGLVIGMLALPLMIAAFFRSRQFRKYMGGCTGMYVWSSYLTHLGFGMLFLIAIEFASRILVWLDPRSGSLLYFAFYGLIILQIFMVARSLLYAAIDFLGSFFLVGQLEQMIREWNELKQKQQQNSSSEGNSSDESYNITREMSKFPEYIYDSQGNAYRLQYASSDHADYYCPANGKTKQIWAPDLNT